MSPSISPIATVPELPDPQRWDRLAVDGTFVAVMDHRRQSRGMRNSVWKTRAVENGAVHEFVSVPSYNTDEAATFNDVAYLGFASLQSGVIAVGDKVVSHRGHDLGTIVGFDETHAPNHLNILLFSVDRSTGAQLALRAGDQLRITNSSQPETNTKQLSYACVRCGSREQAGFHLGCRHCGGLLDPIYDIGNARIRDSSVPQERYFDLLPLQSLDSIVDLGEGNTPLVHAQTLGDRLGLRSLYLKDETKNPTGTTKDRMAACALSMFRELGVREFVASSTGNSSTSFAFGVSRLLDIKVHLFAGKDFADRHAHLDSDNVELHLVDGNFVQAGDAARNFAITNDLVFEGGFFNAARREGLKLAYLEAYDQLPNDPSVVIQAVSSGMGIYGAFRGAHEYIAMGRMQRLPRFVCVQQEACAPIVSAFNAGSPVIRPDDIVDNPVGCAEAILRGDPTNTYPYMWDLMQRSGGACRAVSADEMREARKLLFSLEGIEVEHAAAATIAALKRLTDDGMVQEDETVLVNLTGNNAAARSSFDEYEWRADEHER